MFIKLGFLAVVAMSVCMTTAISMVGANRFIADVVPWQVSLTLLGGLLVIGIGKAVGVYLFFYSNAAAFVRGVGLALAICCAMTSGSLVWFYLHDAAVHYVESIMPKELHFAIMAFVFEASALVLPGVTTIAKPRGVRSAA